MAFAENSHPATLVLECLELNNPKTFYHVSTSCADYLKNVGLSRARLTGQNQILVARVAELLQQPQVFMDYVRRLESQNRMVKRVAFILFFLCFSAIGLIAWQVKKLSRLTTPQGQTKIVSANEFHLMDENGKVQGMLAASSGGAMLFLN